ncbi:MAG: helix-turn-helix domain-containing protein [Planctomycetota bacterium]
MQKTTSKNQAGPAPQPARVTSAAQFDALASPVRDQIVQVVVNQAGSGDRGDSREGVGGVSISEIAEQLGRRPGSLYRHIEALVEVGLLHEVGTQLSGGRDATLYAAPGDYLELQTPGRGGPAMDALCRYLERMATHAGRECAAATRDRAKRRAVLEDETPDDGTVSMFGWLDEGQRDRLRTLMGEVAAVFERAERRPGTRLIAASVLVRPVRLPDGGTAEEPA